MGIKVIKKFNQHSVFQNKVKTYSCTNNTMGWCHSLSMGWIREMYKSRNPLTAINNIYLELLRPLSMHIKLQNVFVERFEEPGEHNGASADDMLLYVNGLRHYGYDIGCTRGYERYRSGHLSSVVDNPKRNGMLYTFSLEYPQGYISAHTIAFFRRTEGCSGGNGSMNSDDTFFIFDPNYAVWQVDKTSAYIYEWNLHNKYYAKYKILHHELRYLIKN